MRQFPKTLLTSTEEAIIEFLDKLSTDMKQEAESVLQLVCPDCLDNIANDHKRTTCIAAGTHMVETECNVEEDGRILFPDVQFCKVCGWNDNAYPETNEDE